jgi:hypothetical protein
VSTAIDRRDPILQEAQQLDLQRQRNVAHFVEEQRAAVGQFDLALGGLDRAGERALLVPEQLAFEQIFGDRRAVDRHERSAVARAGIVQAAREQFLAGSAGAQQHDRDIGARHALDRARHPHHFGCRSDHPAEHAVVLARLVGKPAVFRFDPLDVERAAHDQPQFVDLHRLLVKIISPARNRRTGAFACAMPRSDDHLGVGLHRHDRIEQRQAFGHAVGIGRQSQVERDNGRFFGAQQRQRFCSIAGDEHLEIVISPFELCLQPGIVLDHKQLGQRSAGFGRWLRLGGLVLHYATFL